MVTPTPTTVQVKFQLRIDTAATWASVNPVLLSGEMGLESDTNKFKVGDGSTAWNSLGYFPFVVSGGTVTGNLEIGTTGTLTFEGSTADGFETTLGVVDPTADRTINLPNVSGTVVTTGDTGTVTSTMITDGTIVNADINASAAIEHSKLATITAGYVLIGNSSGVPTATQVTGDVTISDAGVTAISSGVIVDADVSATAEIAVSKLANGTANQVLVTDGTDVSWSDDLTIAGNLTVNGTTTTVNTQTLVVEDKNIELGVVGTPTDLTADSGGITLKGATDKTINWYDATDAWTSSERFSIPLGSAASPSLTFTGDENTGIYSPGADQVAISTNGTGRLFVDASGNVGIGAANSLSELLVAGSNPSIYIKPNADTETSELVFRNAANAQSRGFISYNHSDESMAFRVNLSERMRLDSSGRVGVGTTSPGQLLHLQGGNPALQFEPALDSQNSLIIFRNAADSVSKGLIYYNHSNDSLNFTTNGTTTDASIDSSGRLLVGTSTSAGNAKLEVTETRRLSATQGGSGWLELTDSAAVTSGTLTDIATATVSGINSCYFRLEVLAGHTDNDGGYSQAVSIREGLIGNYASSPRVNASTETRNLSGSINAGVIATAVSTDVVTGASGVNSTFTFRATVTTSGANSAGTSPRLSYRLSLLSISSNAVTAVSAI